MNISQPVASVISSVAFTTLSTNEIKALSAKRIQNPATFDSLLHPVPGGLYDTALGASEDSSCATCNLNHHACPGHPGHIELPVPVYHPTFMSQLFRLLRGKCGYCHHFKLSRVELNRFACQLRLIQHGLLVQSAEMEKLYLLPKSVSRSLARAEGEDDSSGADGPDSSRAKNMMEQRNRFVREAIRNAGPAARHVAKTEAIARERRIVIKEFMAAIVRGKTCENCGGICPSFRSVGFAKIFEQALKPRDFAAMVQKGFKLTNATAILSQERKNREKRQKDRSDIDEGIALSSEEESEGSGESLDDEVLSDSDGDATMQDAPPSHPSNNASKSEPKPQRYVNPGEVHAALTLLFEKEQEILTLVYNARPHTKKDNPVGADMHFISALLIPPNRYRPQVKTGEGEIAEAQQNSLYKRILERCEQINQIHKEMTLRSQGKDPTEEGARRRDFGDLQETWVKLQETVNSLLDRDRNPTQGAAAKRNEDGIKQKLEKKEGLFRQNMMGKRVNFAARSVISPDPNIETNEIGVPPVFAKKLTYPEPVTNHNFYDLKEAVLNGVDKWPGAAAIENENGQVISLRTRNFEERQALANQLLAPSNTAVTGARNKKVHRHLNNGDIVMMNRQPTLHKPSMMAHRARVLPGEKTIRMHYANCNTYNADFDGDEMNMHFPQNEIARAEALQIADTDHQYLVATSGSPLRGLIQDHISMGVWMTNKDTFFDREAYQQLIYSCLRPEHNHTTSDRILLVAPTLLKPKAMWTGKQVITTVLNNIKPLSYPGLTLTSKSQTDGDRWAVGSEEGDVVFKDGEMLCGILDKAQLGPKAGGLIHSVYEAFGHSIAGKLLSSLGRLLTKFLNMRAFTCGMDDLVLTRQADQARRNKLEDVDVIGLEVASKYVGLEEQKPSATDPSLRSRLEEVLRDGEKQTGLDTVMNARTQVMSSEITKACLPDGLVKPFPRNQMQTMTTSGAKGSVVNANLISCNLGQQVLEGKRVPTMVSGKTLPCFQAFDTNVRAGGYVADRFLTGIRPQEYYFHCMAGREGLIDTAVKTSRSGYLQRCLVKGMEGLKVAYDDSVRDTDGSVIQFLYGEDALDVTKQKHLTEFKFVAENFWAHFEQLNVREEFQKIATDDAMDWNKAAMKKVRKTGRLDAMDPVLARFSPSRTPYSTSENFTAALKDYLETNPDKLLRDKKRNIDSPLTKRAFETVLNLKYLKSVVEPGEAVGIIAGQSVGEPSTQMTLNTFHLAGHSAKNVTLGIPRLREIVMTASASISTPSMTLHLNPELTDEEGERFAKAISKLTLADLIDKVSVSERVEQGSAHSRAKIYQIRIDLFPLEEYRREYAIQMEDVVRTLETRFAPRLQKATRQEMKDRRGDGALRNDALPQVGDSAGPIEQVSSRTRAEGEEGAEDVDGDDDNDEDEVTNQKQRAAEAEAYDDPDEEDELTIKQTRKEATPDADMEDEGIGGSPKDSTHRGDDGEDDEEKLAKDSGGYVQSEGAKDREERVKAKCNDVTKFDFDDEGGQWCEIQLEYRASSPKILMLNLVESACRAAVVQSIEGLGTCTYTKEKVRDRVTGTESTMATVVTDGVNLAAMHAYQSILNPHKIFTNDIASTRTHYGVEACRANIIREMEMVFSSHSISVDNRHLNLIADMMTRGGQFQPFNRYGMSTGVSPFLKMSFETTVACLKDAVLEADWDDLDGSSSRIVMGKVGKVGTGAFDVLTPMQESK